MDDKPANIKIFFIGVQATLLGLFVLGFFGSDHAFTPLSILLVSAGVAITAYGVNRWTHLLYATRNFYRVL